MEEFIEQIGILTPALVIGLGLSAGIEHAFEPDHVAAVSTQISKSKFQKPTRQIVRVANKIIAFGNLLGSMTHNYTDICRSFGLFISNNNTESNIFGI